MAAQETNCYKPCALILPVSVEYTSSKALRLGEKVLRALKMTLLKSNQGVILMIIFYNHRS